MRNQQASGNGCGSCFLLLFSFGFFGWVFYTIGEAMYGPLHSAWIFLLRPDASARIIEFLIAYIVAVPICLGAGWVIVMIVGLIPDAWWYKLMGMEPSNREDEYND